MPSDFIKKFRTCHPFRDDLGWGTIATLSGCVAFWNLRCHKYIKQLNEEYGMMTPEQLNASAWIINLILKGVGLGFYIKALKDYKKC